MDRIIDHKVLPGTILISRVTASWYHARRLLGVDSIYIVLPDHTPPDRSSTVFARAMW